MTRPLTGQREVMRRLQERNQGRRQRTNEVREMGGLEPIPEPEVSSSYTIRQVEEHIRNYLSGYVGRPNNPDTQRALLDSIMSGEYEPPRLIAGRSNTGRSSLGLSQLAAYQAITDHPVMYLDVEANLNRNVYSGFGVARELLENESPRMISTQVPPWSMSYLDTGLPVGRVDEMVTDFIGKDIQCNLGSMSINDYLRQEKLNKVKQKENANNKDFKFILEKEY